MSVLTDLRFALRTTLRAFLGAAAARRFGAAFVAALRTGRRAALRARAAGLARRCGARFFGAFGADTGAALPPPALSVSSRRCVTSSMAPSASTVRIRPV